MICKQVDYKIALSEWDKLINGGSLSPQHLKDASIRRAGLRAEKDMAYYLDAELGGKPELLIFNNLQFEHRDLTAQIDHLVLSRWCAYFIETKSASQKTKININQDGQWARVTGKQYDNFESPLAQGRRHQARLYELLESRIPEFMGKILGLQKHFSAVIETQHLVAVSVGATITGKGKKAVEEHIWDLDEIPKQIHDHHLSVRSSMLGSVLSGMRDPKTTKRDPAFSKQELDACRRLLLAADISKPPLTMVHEFMEKLPAPKPRPPAAVNIPKPSAAQQPIQICPKCGSEMVLRTAKRGDRKGKQFYGCSNYPKCRKMINVD